MTSLLCDELWERMLCEAPAVFRLLFPVGRQIGSCQNGPASSFVISDNCTQQRPVGSDVMPWKLQPAGTNARRLVPAGSFDTGNHGRVTSVPQARCGVRWDVAANPQGLSTGPEKSGFRGNPQRNQRFGFGSLWCVARYSNTVHSQKYLPAGSDIRRS
jgi:hypothetical protein